MLESFLNLECFLEPLENLGLKVIAKMAPMAGEKYIYKRFHVRPFRRSNSGTLQRRRMARS